MRVDDPHRRTASLLYSRMPSGITQTQRRHGEVINILAAHGMLHRTKLIAEMAGITETEAHGLCRLFRERVLGVTKGVDL